jgi:hypothetical protein
VVNLTRLETNYGGRYLVFAHGGTDGPLDGMGNHGETCSTGWSNGGHFVNLGALAFVDKSKKARESANKGNISARRTDGKLAKGWVKFIRLGKFVEAWGYLDWQNDNDKKKNDYFIALLLFDPLPETDLARCGPLDLTRIRNATLIGAAVIFNDYVQPLLLLP